MHALDVQIETIVVNLRLSLKMANNKKNCDNSMKLCQYDPPQEEAILTKFHKDRARIVYVFGHSRKFSSSVSKFS